MNSKHLIFAAVLFFSAGQLYAGRTTVTIQTDHYRPSRILPVYAPTYYPSYNYPVYSYPTTYAYWPASYTYDDFYYDYNYDSPISAVGKAFAVMGIAGLAVVLIDAILNH